jgi:hypothetical protein
MLLRIVVDGERRVVRRARLEASARAVVLLLASALVNAPPPG